MSDRFYVTEENQELFGVVEDMVTMIESGQPTPRPDEAYWAEELIPPMTEDPDEVVANTMLGGSYLPQGPQAGFTLWRGMKGYRISVSKLPD
jgi:hypothetical protein